VTFADLAGSSPLETVLETVAASGTNGDPVTVWFYNIGIGRRNGAYIVSVGV
jgi:hypothetical protein